MLKRFKSAFAVLAAASLVSACATLNGALKEPEVSVTGMQIKGVSMSDMKLDFTLGVDNPNPLGVKLSGLNYKLDVDGNSLLAGDTKNKLKVAANSKANVTLPLDLRYKDLAGGIGALLNKDEVAYELSGSMDFGLFSVPYKKRGTLKLPTLPKVSVAWVDIERMTLSGMDITVVLQLDNRNTFPVKLDGIHYDLKLGDTSLLTGRSLRPLTLKPDAIGRLGIGVKMSYQNMGHVVSMLANNNELPVAFNGEMDIPGAGTVPVNWEGKVNISH